MKKYMSVVIVLISIVVFSNCAFAETIETGNCGGNAVWSVIDGNVLVI